jgi:hypothetical protein
MSEPIPRSGHTVQITGGDLDVAAVCAIARADAPVVVAGAARERMQAASELVAPLGEDRPLGVEIERPAGRLVRGRRLAARVADAAAVSGSAS